MIVVSTVMLALGFRCDLSKRSHRNQACISSGGDIKSHATTAALQGVLLGL
jgi:hypothetical protein